MGPSSRMSLADLQLRPFSLHDAPAVARWLRGKGLSVPVGSIGVRWAERLLTNPRVRAFVAWSGNVRVGFARLDVGPDRVAELTITVAARLQRRGVGSAVLKAVLAWAKVNNLRKIQAIVDRQNIPAIRFFVEHCFEDQAGDVAVARFVYWLHGPCAEVLDLDA